MNAGENKEEYREDRLRRKHHQINKWLLRFVFLLLAVIIGYIVWQLFGAEPETVAESAETADYVDYSASAEVQEALKILSSEPSKANVISKDISTNKKVTLTFDGIVDSITMQHILTLLEKYDMTGTFFISGLQAAENSDVVKDIVKANHEIGSYTLHAEKHMETLSQEELAIDFCSSKKILTVVTDKKPEKLKCNVTEYTDELLEVASASGFDNVVQSTVFLNYTSFNSYEATESYVNKLGYRSIVTVKLNEVLDAAEYEAKEVVETPALDKQASLVASDTPSINELSEKERLLHVIEWLLIAIQNSNYSKGAEELCIINSGKLAEPINNLRTSQAAVGYLFYGINRIDELIDILDYLNSVDGTGTFFVTAEDIENHPEQIKMLIERGQAIGLAVLSHEDTNVYSACFDMLNAKTLLEDRFDYNDIKLIMQPWGKISDTVKEAASAMGCDIVSYDLAVASSINKNAYNANQLITSIYGNKDSCLNRGQLIFFRMNYFEKPNLIGEFIELLDETRNIYPVIDVFTMINSTGNMYTYPLPEENILDDVKDEIYPGQLSNDVLEIAKEHYIGNVYINSKSQLPGFSSSEIRGLDKIGRIDNDNNAIFITFDDWGTDVSLTKILNVLNKHNAKATFFIRTNFIDINPNLLRAIGSEGHSIGSHTNNHIPLAVTHILNNKLHFDSISEEETDVLQKDVLESYEKLQSIVGDMVLENGEPVLCKLFRPPTLAVSKKGMETVFDCGFTYIINGDYATQDYEAESAEALYKGMKKNIKSGSVVVMHMSPNCIYTAEALDMFLTYNEQKDEAEQFICERLPDYLAE